MGRVLVVGEALVDVVHRVDGEIDKHPGGSPLNVAIGLARLGHPVDFATRFGNDPDGYLIAEHLAEEPDVTVTKGSDAAAKTSVAAAFLDASGAATYHFDLMWDVAGALDDQPIGHLHLGSIAATLLPGASDVLTLARATSAAGGTVSYDPNARPTIMGSPLAVLPQMETLIGLADVVKASDEDIAWLYGTESIDNVLRRWVSMGPALAVVTRGGEGASALVRATGETAVVEPDPADVVDTVGAGDSFMAGLISGLLDAGLLGDVEARSRLHTANLETLLPALRRAAAASAITVSRAGANPPTRDELPAHLLFD